MTEGEKEDDEKHQKDLDFRTVFIERTHELKSVLLLIVCDVIAVSAILLSLTFVSFLLQSASGTVTKAFASAFHACHEGIGLSLLIILGVRTIDHFIGGYLTLILKSKLSHLWETGK